MTVLDARPGPLDRTLTTPEGLELHLTLAGVGERAAALLVDGLILIAAIAALAFTVGSTMAFARQDAQEALVIIWLLGGFVARNGYFVGFEMSDRAATPGKRVMGLRVIARDGGRLTAESILARNALREIELFLPLTLLAGSAVQNETPAAAVIALALVWSGIFLLFPLFNRDRLRVGDLFAGTWVVRLPRARLMADLAGEAAQHAPRFAFTTEQASAYGVKELELLEEVLRRADPAAMTAVAERIRRKIGFVMPAGETDRAFLEAYYGALRGRLEHRLLFGHRRRDKFDAA